tara:strand:+ start:721 stop:957 length:237 start_codon:yes stop_codon:yes gene_type:complete
MADIIEKFKDIRKYKSYSHKELAEGTKVSGMTIYSWESKMRQPTLRNFNEVLNKMGYELQIKPRETIPFYGDNKHLMG